MAQLAYQGKEGCQDLRCTRMHVGSMSTGGNLGPCHGWHCAVCHEPSSSQGHPECQRKIAEEGA